jgi:hypothetical protein
MPGPIGERTHASEIVGTPPSGAADPPPPPEHAAMASEITTMDAME